MQNTDQMVQNTDRNEREKVILVGIETGAEEPEEQSLDELADLAGDRKSTRLNSSHRLESRMPSSA